MGKSRSVGVDIGATAIRVVEVAGLDADSLALVTRCAIVPLRAGAVVGGQILDQAAVSWALSRALKDAGVNPYGVVLGISSGEAAVAPVTLPTALRPEEWVRTLRTTAPEISPRVPLVSSAVSMYPLAAVVEDNEARRPFLVGVGADDEVTRMLQVASRAKVTPRALDLAAAGTVRAMTRLAGAAHDVATVVDIGASKVTVATRQGHHLRSVRTFEGGGERATRAIMGALGCSAEEAEDLKMSMRLTSGASAAPSPAPAPVTVGNTYGQLQQSTVSVSPGGDVAQDALNTATSALVDQIANEVEADTALHPGAPTQGLQLCGGASMLRGLKEALVQRVGVPAMVGRPWARVVPSRRTEVALMSGPSASGEVAEDPAVILTLAAAIGLALWKDPS